MALPNTEKSAQLLPAHEEDLPSYTHWRNGSQTPPAGVAPEHDHEERRGMISRYSILWKSSTALSTRQSRLHKYPTTTCVDRDWMRGRYREMQDWKHKSSVFDFEVDCDQQLMWALSKLSADELLEGLKDSRLLGSMIARWASECRG